jgi:hypothetical protein
MISHPMRERGEEGEWDEWGRRGNVGPFFSYALLPPIRPILPLLPVLALKKSRAMLRCQIKRLKKTDPKEPYTYTVDIALYSILIMELFKNKNNFEIENGLEGLTL